MWSCHKLWVFLLLAIMILVENLTATAKSVKSAKESGTTQLHSIIDDVIPDEIEKSGRKVIRVSPLDLPILNEDPNTAANKEDSALYKIQSLKPYKGHRKYINMERFSQPLNEGKRKSLFSNSAIITGLTVVPTPDKTVKPKHRPKNKNLHFLYNQENLSGHLLPKSMPVHVAPGAYPVYYVLAKTDGRFGKYPVKSFSSPQAFMKYLLKNKVENMPALQTNEGQM